MRGRLAYLHRAAGLREKQAIAVYGSTHLSGTTQIGLSPPPPRGILL